MVACDRLLDGRDVVKKAKIRRARSGERKGGGKKVAALSLPTPTHPCFSHHFFTARLYYYLGAGSLERAKLVASLYLNKLRTGFY